MLKKVLFVLSLILLMGGCEWLLKTLSYYTEIVITEPDNGTVIGSSTVSISVDTNFSNIDTITLDYETGSRTYDNPYYNAFYDLEAYRQQEDDSYAKPTDMDFTYTFTGVPLVENSNTLTVSGYDRFTGDTVEDTITLYRDTTGPVITINALPNGGVISGTSVSFSGTVSDVHSSVAAMLYQGDNGEFGNIEKAANGTWSFTLSNLQNGTQTITVLAWDGLGNQSSGNVSVTFTYTP